MKKNFKLLTLLCLVCVFVSSCSTAKTSKLTDDDTRDRSHAETKLSADETESAFQTESIYQLTDSMSVTVNNEEQWIRQEDTVNGIDYSLTLYLNNAAGYTSEEQLVICTKVFWYCYPQMYELMAVENTPRDVNLLVENEGYEIAEQWGDNVHIHDQWLYNNPDDYDCLTHEFAHVIQTDWSGEYSPQYNGDSYLIERFADACRYIYAYDGGRYNDESWTLWTPDVEDHYSTSNRFWVWIERTYSTDDIDIFGRLVEQTQIMDEDHEYQNWDADGDMWDVIFMDTEAEGYSLDELWELFLESDFAYAN